MSKRPKWFDDEIGIDPEEGVKARANRLEKKLAERLSKIGGQRQPASGAFWNNKGDVKIGHLALGDSKSTKNKSINISKRQWEKIKKECLEGGKDIPFLQLQMNETEPLVVLSENDFIMLLESMITKIGGE